MRGQIFGAGGGAIIQKKNEGEKLKRNQRKREKRREKKRERGEKGKLFVHKKLVFAARHGLFCLRVRTSGRNSNKLVFWGGGVLRNLFFQQNGLTLYLHS